MGPPSSVARRDPVWDRSHVVGRTVGIALFVTAVGVGLTLAAARYRGIPIATITRDAASTLGAPVYTGIGSDLGALLWCAATAMCGLTAAVVRRRGGPPRLTSFLFASAVVSGWLLLDDFFLLHEAVLSIAVGIPQPVVYVIYVVVMFAWLAWYHPDIRRTDYLLLVCALGSFALSTVIDAVREFGLVPDPDVMFLVEEGPKFLGIVLWFAYFGRVCLLSLERDERLVPAQSRCPDRDVQP